MKLRELVVLSHLRWVFVWQRPQHLISRFAAGYGRTWFVEEPLAVEGVTEPVLRVEEHDRVTRVWLEVPVESGIWGFDAAACAIYSAELARLLGERPDRAVWLYTPMALDVARSLRPSVLVYDVMDDLAAFRFAPPALVLRQRQALRDAHVVFTGGRSLHRAVTEHRPSAHCFPSGVEPEHYAAAAECRAARPAGRCPVAGYVGVIDERLDFGLIAALADALPDWEIRMVGPVLKVDPEALPQAANITYAGPRPYAELPEVMGGFDVALMPFAMNEATRAISPTKTLEYLAAGLPVVSTPVPDVVADYAEIVRVCDDAAAFARACCDAVAECGRARAERCGGILRTQHWDTIAASMAALVDAASEQAATERETA